MKRVNISDNPKNHSCCHSSKKTMKYLSLLFLGIISGISHASETEICNENDRCFNTETNSFWGLGLTFTPSYKNQYDIDLLDIDVPCENKDVPIDKKTTLPKKSYFRQTLDKAAQNEDEIIVHVYELDKMDNDADGEATKKEYFSTPHKVCLKGENKVDKSNYTRVGGVSTGLLVVPFKLRDGDIYSDSTIGPYISYKWEVVEILATAGLSQVSVSQVGSENVESETGLTAALGINFEIDKNWDISFLVGADHLSGETGDNWKYQDDAWFSFGIGFNFTR